MIAARRGGETKVGIDWSRIMTPNQMARIAATRDEMARLHALPDRWLAEALLRMAREARSSHPDLRDPFGDTYSPAFLWQAVPEAARRLGGKLSPNEAADPSYRTMPDAEFRAMLGIYLKNVSLSRYADPAGRDRARPSAMDLLGHEFVNGNPVAMAADRICPPPPPGDDRGDWIARHTREISRTRGHGETAEWHPGILGRAEPEEAEVPAPSV